MAPAALFPSRAKSAAVPCPASTTRASSGPLVDGDMGAATLLTPKTSGESTRTSAVPGSHFSGTEKASLYTLGTPVARKRASAQATARTQAAVPVGRPPTWSQRSSNSLGKGVSPAARLRSAGRGSAGGTAVATPLATKKQTTPSDATAVPRVMLGGPSSLFPKFGERHCMPGRSTSGALSSVARAECSATRPWQRGAAVYAVGRGKERLRGTGVTSGSPTGCFSQGASAGAAPSTAGSRRVKRAPPSGRFSASSWPP